MKLQRFTAMRTVWIVPLILSASLTYAQFTTGVSLVEVYATVTDSRGEPITNLASADFRVLQDGRLQTITAFAAGEFPLAVAIGIDRSFSMAGKNDRLSLAKAAARTFLDALRGDDQVMVLAIGSDTEIAAPLSTDRTAARAAIGRLEAWGTTPLYDAILVALDAIQSSKGRRALVLLSDGTDRYSETNAAALVDEARRRDVLIYPIAIGPARPPVFAELATSTGGRSFLAKEPRDLGGILTAIARELRFQYLLGYVPPPSTGSSWHAIDVEVDRPGVRVRARDGYFSR
jgi:Ca-activated chloride channel family protein